MDHRIWLGIHCPDIKRYAFIAAFLGVFDYLIEPRKLLVQVTDKKMVEFMARTFPGLITRGCFADDEGKEYELTEVLEIMNERFPAPFSLSEVFLGEFDEEPGKETERKLRRFERLQRDNLIELPITLKSPEQWPFRITEQNLELYCSRMVDILGPHLPDDIEATRRLLNGQDDMIHSASRSFSLVFPLHDVTNSTLLMRMRETLHDYKTGENRTDGACLITEIDHLECLHLFVFLFQYTCECFPDCQWFMVTKPVFTDLD